MSVTTSLTGDGLTFENKGAAAAVLHVYDKLRLDQVPRRYTVGPGQSLDDTWPAGPRDLWVLGPNGFHRRFAGQTRDINVFCRTDPAKAELAVVLLNGTRKRQTFVVSAEGPHGFSKDIVLKPGELLEYIMGTEQGWYDVSVRCSADPTWLRRLAGRIETGQDSITDPLMGGAARLTA